MSGSKPEELVAKLYDDGMSDDEVREQLIDFGLSGREIHHLIKKAKKLMVGAKGGSRRSHREAPEGGDEPEEPTIQTEPDPMIRQLVEEAKGSPAAGEPGPVKPEPGEPIDIPKLPKEGSVELKEPKSEEESKELDEDEEEEKPKEKRSGFLSGIFKKKKRDEGTGRAEKKEEDEKEEKKEKKPPKPEEKKPKGEKKGKPEHHDAAYMAKMKRLTMIKEAISSPVAPSSDSRWASEGELEKTPEETPEKEPTPKKDGMGDEIDKIIGKPADATTNALTTEEEEKMDEETAKRLTGGMEKLETEMGEIKQLLDTLRELNIKMIELMEKK